MRGVKLVGLASVGVLSAVLMGCGGGGGGSNTTPTAGTSSVGVSSVAAPAKTAAESFYDFYGVRAGIYEVTYTSATGTVVTQGRILANEVKVGGAWGFSADIDFCNDIGEEWMPSYYGDDMKQGDLPWGQIYYQPLRSNFGENIVLVADAGAKVLKGERFNEINNEKETITMRWVSGDKDYSQGTINLSTSEDKLTTINSTSLCYSVTSELVEDQGQLIERNSIFINVLKPRVSRVFGEGQDAAGTRVAGIHIYERDFGTDNSFFYLQFKDEFTSSGYVETGLVNKGVDEFGDPTAETTYATSTDLLNFNVDMKGITGTEAEGFFVKGSINLKTK